MTTNINYLFFPNMRWCLYIYYLLARSSVSLIVDPTLITWSAHGSQTDGETFPWNTIFGLLYSWNRNHLYDLIYANIYRLTMRALCKGLVMSDKSFIIYEQTCPQNESRWNITTRLVCRLTAYDLFWYCYWILWSNSLYSNCIYRYVVY